VALPLIPVILLLVNIPGALSMRAILLLILCAASFSAFAQTAPTDPTDPKAKATFAEGEALRKSRQYSFAVDAFRKANKQDGGHCQVCMLEAVRSALQMADYKSAEQSAHTLLDMATTNDEKGRLTWSLASCCCAKAPTITRTKTLRRRRVS
jgi:hypothetical protein